MADLRILLLAAVVGLLPAQARAGEAGGPWTGAALATGAVVGASLLDDEARGWFRRNRGLESDLIADQVRVLGRPRIWATVSVGWLAVGLAMRDPDVARPGARVTAGVALAGLATRGFKYTVGRARPFHEEGPGSFDAFSNRTSFPSGHATMTFALAEGVAHEAGHRGITALCYGLAGLTAWSRLNDDNHWWSDTVAGAVLGVGCARLARWGVSRWGRGALRVVPGPVGPALAWSSGF